MGTDPARQALELLKALLLGTGLGLGYDLLRPARRRSGRALGAALSLCVLPFLPGDAVKIIGASLMAAPIRKAIKNSAVS